MRKEHTVEDCIDSFSRVETISEIIILGTEGGIRRILLEDEDSDPDPDIDDDDYDDLEDPDDEDNEDDEEMR